MAYFFVYYSYSSDQQSVECLRYAHAMASASATTTRVLREVQQRRLHAQTRENSFPWYSPIPRYRPHRGLFLEIGHDWHDMLFLFFRNVSLYKKMYVKPSYARLC